MKYDLTGKQIGVLIVIKPIRINGQLKWETICVCGNISHHLTTDLRNGKVKSCGCKRGENVKISTGITPEYIQSGTKVCVKCREEKNKEDHFYKREGVGDGFRNDCIECHLKNKKIYSKENSQHKRDYMSQYRVDNPEVMKIWIENNREQYLWNTKKWKMENPEKSKEHKNNNRRKRLKNDPLFRLKSNIRRLILLSFSKKGYSKKSKTNEILGIDYEGFMKHIESQFTEGMTWENRREWELDHKFPISLGKTEEEIIKLNHYSNFQPLWREDNRKKSNKILY
jgi:hypothetical protein